MPGQPWMYDEESKNALVAAISVDRFQTYLEVAGSDEAALQLYVWNTAASTGLYPVLQTLEVSLRNAVHSAMTANADEWWFEDPNLMRASELSDVAKARDWLVEKAKPVTPGRLVAELPMGFWVALFSNKYDQTLWRTTLAALFPKHLRQRRPIHDDLDRLRTLRNRIAHHEPIFQRNLAQDLSRVRKVVGCLSLDVLSWMDHHLTVKTVLASAPADVVEF